MTILSLTDFMIKNILKKDTTKESELQRVYNYPFYPKVSKLLSDKSFVNIDNGSMGGTHWCVVYVRNNKCFYRDNFGGQPDKFSLNELPKPLLYHNYKIQDINSNICASYFS